MLILFHHSHSLLRDFAIQSLRSEVVQALFRNMTDREPSPSGSEASGDSAVDLSESEPSNDLEACDDLFDGIVIALSGKIPDRDHGT